MLDITKAATLTPDQQVAITDLAHALETEFGAPPLNDAALIGLETDEFEHWIVSDVRKPDGGRPTPHYEVYKAFRDIFGAGAKLVASNSSSSRVEVIATCEKTMLINKSQDAIVVKFNDKKTLDQIDAVFVTVEPRGGSERPTGKPLLFAYLNVAANHP